MMMMMGYPHHDQGQPDFQDTQHHRRYHHHHHPHDIISKTITCPPDQQLVQCPASPQVEPKSLKSSGFPAPDPGEQCHHHHHHITIII